MDKKNTIIGVLLLVTAFALLIYGAKTTPRPPPAPEVARSSTGTGGGTTGGNRAPGPVTSTLPATGPDNATFAAVNTTDTTAKTITLSNDYIEAHFVDLGGAIESVALKKYPAEKGKPDPFLFNRLHVDPLLAFSQESFPGLSRTVRYEVVSQTPSEVVFRTVFENRIEVTRRYTLAPSTGASDHGDPYQIRHEVTFKNLTQQTEAVPHFALNLGTGAPTNATDYGIHLSTGYNDGKSIEFINRSDLQGGGFRGMVGLGPRGPVPLIETPVSLVWAAVEDQFFVSILTPDTPGRSLITRRVELPAPHGESRPLIGVTGSAGFDVPALAAQAETKLGMTLYVGPKEYKRLSNSDVFKHDEDKVMQFGRLSFFSELLLTMMTSIHGWLEKLGMSKQAWGLAIIVTTLSLKLVFLPLTLAASKSSRRMQKIQPEMKAMREKYKDNPQKMNQATMELFKAHKVNPAGGCLPVLITIPFFFGFYRMLGSTAELRFAEFLWAKDLSAPDTVVRIFDYPLNIMPLLLGATMVLQMRFTPQPTVDNSQQKIFKFMPYMFTLFCYNLSCALSLYSTVNGLFTIAQQMIINRLKDDGDPASKPAVAPGPRGSMKNVTPGKKKVK